MPSNDCRPSVVWRCNASRLRTSARRWRCWSPRWPISTPDWLSLSPSGWSTTTQGSSLSERARELASLRVLGFTSGEVFRILLLELALLTLVAQPPGWAIGYGLAWTLQTKMAGEVMRARLVVEHSTYALASAIVIFAAAFSAMVMRERINRLDLVSVLKTRD